MLNCSGTLISEIKVYDRLRFLNCANCPNIGIIPRMPVIFSINMENCRMLTCSDKKAETKSVGCYWYNPPQNRLDKLIYLQRRFRKWKAIRNFKVRLSLVKWLPLVMVDNVMKYV